VYYNLLTKLSTKQQLLQRPTKTKTQTKIVERESEKSLKGKSMQNLTLGSAGIVGTGMIAGFIADAIDKST